MDPLSALYGGAELEGFPVWLSNLWRVLLWLAMVAWLAKMVDRWVYSRRVESGTLFWLRIGLFIMLAQAAWTQAHNWDEPVAWDTVPIVTAAVFCAWMSTYRYSNPRADDPVLVHSPEELRPQARELGEAAIRRYSAGDHPQRRATD